eukprot:Phypoly_transcript_13724.p1 GENE.Phypoly_transcript_13724~~Phypoly_transcript_13724.p1  ORF type:complete len:265 (+),score=31.33 Phypoly_transcript_13724:217-1011(+)
MPQRTKNQLKKKRSPQSVPKAPRKTKKSPTPPDNENNTSITLSLFRNEKKVREYCAQIVLNLLSNSLQHPALDPLPAQCIDNIVLLIQDISFLILPLPVGINTFLENFLIYYYATDLPDTLRAIYKGLEISKPAKLQKTQGRPKRPPPRFSALPRCLLFYHLFYHLFLFRIHPTHSQKTESGARNQRLETVRTAEDAVSRQIAEPLLERAVKRQSLNGKAGRREKPDYTRAGRASSRTARREQDEKGVEEIVEYCWRGFYCCVK